MKKILSEVLPDRTFLTMKECLDTLGWTYTDNGQEVRDITCCGQLVKTGGWLFSEHAHCSVCGKGMQHFGGALPGGNNTVCFIDWNEVQYPEDDRIWVAENVWGWK